jgi:formyl-CoA transferase
MLPSFMAMNLNKQSITLNLKTDEARTIVQQLVRKSDVLIENFKAGTMERLGLGFEDLKPHKSDLIYCSVTGYGQTGPKAGEAAYDGAIQASSGMMSQTGHPETGPTRTGFKINHRSGSKN